MGQLHRLSNLDLSNNLLTGNLDGLATLPHTLTLLRLENNLITGSVPWNFTFFPAASSLDFSTNLIGGNIPQNWTLLGDDYVDISFSGNRLAGPLSKSWRLPDTSMIYLSNNSFGGTLPWDLNLSVSTLDISYNSLTGTIPSNWTLTQAGSVDLSNNNLTGPLPVEWAVTTNTQLSIVNNSFTGALCCQAKLLLQYSPRKCVLACGVQACCLPGLCGPTSRLLLCHNGGLGSAAR